MRDSHPPKRPPAVGVQFIYVPVSDLVRTRDFYGRILDLDELHFSEDAGHLAYDCDGLQLLFFRDDAARPAGPGWARQPGWSGGTQPTISWSVVLDEQRFRSAMGELMASGHASLLAAPAWVGYWSFPAKDPMGHTVEVCWSPPDTPRSPTWLPAPPATHL